MSTALTQLVVPSSLDGERLDRALVELLPSWSRSQLAAFVRDGRVKLQGSTVTKPGQAVETGQVVSVDLPPAYLEVSVEEARAGLPILHEDEQFLVIDKPAGLLVHRASDESERSLVDYVQALYGELPARQGDDLPGVVHRLDRDTSGVLVMARTEPAMEELLRQFREQEVEKTYLALVHGAPRFQSDWIEEPLGRSKRHPDRIAVRPEGEGRAARTYYEVRERFAGHALLECKPKTGRTHQIRVHLASIAHPLVGDALYIAHGRKLAPWPAGSAQPERHMLHAARLAFRDPSTGTPLVFESPLPEDFAAALAALRLTVGA